MEDNLIDSNQTNEGQSKKKVTISPQFIAVDSEDSKTKKYIYKSSVSDSQDNIMEISEENTKNTNFSTTKKNFTSSILLIGLAFLIALIAIPAVSLFMLLIESSDVFALLFIPVLIIGFIILILSTLGGMIICLGFSASRAREIIKKAPTTKAKNWAKFLMILNFLLMVVAIGYEVVLFFLPSLF